MVGAAIVGIVGAAGVFIYEQIYAEKSRSMLGKHLIINSIFFYIILARKENSTCIFFFDFVLRSKNVKM